MITFKRLNNLDNLFPNKVLRYFSIDCNTIKSMSEFRDNILNNTIGFLGVIDKRDIRHCIFIFNKKDDLDNFTAYLNKNKIDYKDNKYTYRVKSFLNDIFNENVLETNVDI